MNKSQNYQQFFFMGKNPSGIVIFSSLVKGRNSFSEIKKLFSIEFGFFFFFKV